MNFAPCRLSMRATRNSRSGGLHAWTMSTGPILRASRNVCHSAELYSLRYPAGPPVAARSG